MSVFNKSLPLILGALKLNYTHLTLIIAALFVIADAIGVFVCLRRAENSARWVSFLAPSSAFLALTGVIFCNLQKFVNVMLHIKIGIPPVCGFIAAAAAGMLTVGFSLLICGSCVMKIGGRIGLCATSLIFASAEAFLLFRVYTVADGHAEADLSIGSVFAGITDLPESLSGIHTDWLTAVLFILFVTAVFLCFISNKDRYEIAEGEKNVRVCALERRYGVTGDKARERFCCRYCQYASALKCEPDCVLCEGRGVVAADHICTEYVYDPLKKEPETSGSRFSEMKLTPPQAVSADDKPESSDPKAVSEQKSAQVAALMDSIKKKEHSK